MLLQFFKHANGKFILLILLFFLFLRLGIGIYLDLDLIMIATAFLLHCISAVCINRIFAKNLLIKKYSILPAFIFLLLSSAQHLLSYNNTIIPFLLFCLTLVNLSNIYPAEKVNKRIFDSGLILSSSIIINPLLVLITTPLIFIFQMLYGFNQAKRILISITALLTPILIYFSCKFIILSQTDFIDTTFQSSQLTINNISNILTTFIFPIAISAVSIYDLQSNFQNKKALSRKFILLFMIQGLIHLILLTITPLPTYTSIFILLPMTLLITNYFEHIKAKWIHQTLFALFIIISCLSPFFL